MFCTTSQVHLLLENIQSRYVKHYGVVEENLTAVELFRRVPLSDLILSDVSVQNKFLLSLPKLT